MAASRRDRTRASDTEMSIFLGVIDARIAGFLDAVASYDVEPGLLDEIRRWTEGTRIALRNAFSAWYRENIEGMSIPKELVVPKPRQGRIYKRYTKAFADSSCEVCGDTRVLNIAHIIPRQAGGPDEQWNLMRLCADHHYLFDSGQLTEEEWSSIDWPAKDPRVRAYALEHRRPAHEPSWRREQ